MLKMFSASLVPFSVLPYLQFYVKASVRFIISLPGVRSFVSLISNVVINSLKTACLPRHVAFIMDGNRRYAKEHSVGLEGGHSAGARNLVSILSVCYQLNVYEVSVYAFSIENFNRSQKEVDTLFSLLREKLEIFTDGKSEESLTFANIRVRLIGNRSMMPQDVLDSIEGIERKTEHCSGGVLNICAPYTSRDEICHSIQQICEKSTHESIEITAKTLEDNFYYGKESHKVDILVRTSGETRLSDFLLWQCNEDAIIYFVDTLWPDFNVFELLKVFVDWSYKRSFGQSFTSSERVDLKTLPAAPPLVTVTKK